MSLAHFQAVALWLAQKLEARFSAREVGVWARVGVLDGFSWPQAGSFEDAGALPLSEGHFAYEIRFFVGIAEENESVNPSLFWEMAGAASAPSMFFMPYAPPGTRRLDVAACVRVPQAELTLRLGTLTACPDASERSLEQDSSAARFVKGLVQEISDGSVDFSHCEVRRSHSHTLFPGFSAAERARHVEAIVRLQEHMCRGDCYLINYTTRVQIPLSPSAFLPTEFLMRWFLRPTRFGAFLRFDAFALMSFSPERFVRAARGMVMAEPIKGTLALADPRAPALSDAQALWSQEKEIFEQTMVTDLLRNDLNAVSRSGTVKVHSPFFAAIAGPILQMQSFVVGRLRERLTLSTALRCLLPAGSVTGTPKVRACELIREAEASPRGAYTGVVGVADGPCEFDTALLIRSLFLHGEDVVAGVGAGITTLSNPERELDEFELKLRSFLAVFEGGS